MIPKIIHHIWVGDKPKPSKIMKTWQEKHPDFQYIEWNEKVFSTIKFRCQKQIDQMMSAGRYNGVADIMRYEILYELGGFVAPADSICLNSIEDLLDCDCFCCYENETCRPGLLSPHIGSYQGNEFLNTIIERIAKMDNMLWADPWIVTGNKLLTDIVEETGYKIKVYPSHYFIPDHYTGLSYRGDGKIYAKHLWGTTKSIYGELDEMYAQN